MHVTGLRTSTIWRDVKKTTKEVAEEEKEEEKEEEGGGDSRPPHLCTVVLDAFPSEQRRHRDGLGKTGDGCEEGRRLPPMFPERCSAVNKRG
jgi:hypothetical protein